MSYDSQKLSLKVSPEASDANVVATCMGVFEQRVTQSLTFHHYLLLPPRFNGQLGEPSGSQTACWKIPPMIDFP